MAETKQTAAAKPKPKAKPEPVAGAYPLGPLARKDDETDAEFETRRQAEYPKGIHDPVVNTCGVCGTIPPQGFELKLVQEDGSVLIMHNAPATPVAYQAMLAHYKQQHPDAKVPKHSDELDVPPADLLAELLDRTRDANGKIVDPKAKPAGFPA